MLGKVILLLADVLAIICLARMLLQWGQLHYSQPLAEFCRSSTDWLIKPLRRLVPPLGRWDSACVLAVMLIYYAAFSIIMLLGLPHIQISTKMVLANVLFTLFSTLKALAYCILLGLVVRMILSFSAPASPLMPVLQRIFEPLTRPFAMLRIGRVDFSATVVVVVLWLWLTWFLPQLMSQLNLWLLQ